MTPPFSICARPALTVKEELLLVDVPLESFGMGTEEDDVEVVVPLMAEPLSLIVMVRGLCV